jgi:hypothetical protein
LNFLNSKYNFKKDLGQIQLLSEKIEKKLSKSNFSNTIDLDRFTLEELQDIHKLSELASFMLLKYEDKKETHSILQHFVSIITESGESIDQLDDEIAMLILGAEDSINKVKNIHSKISEKSEFGKSDFNEMVEDGPKICSINLTKIARVVNSPEYQPKSQVNNAQVI